MLEGSRCESGHTKGKQNRGKVCDAVVVTQEWCTPAQCSGVSTVRYHSNTSGKVRVS